MILITGGRRQGKLDFARARFGLTEADIQICEEGADIDFDRRCLAYLERWALGCVRRGQDPVACIAAHSERVRRSVIILSEIGCGVVPVEADLRAWQADCGRLAQTLADESDEVWRLFCGLPQRLK